MIVSDETALERLLVRIQLAKRDINEMVEMVMVTAEGNRITQAEIHRLMHAHIKFCHGRGQYAGIVAPFGHGKTEQIMAYCLAEIGKNPSIRIKLICNTSGNSEARGKTIRNYLDTSWTFKLVYPGLLPDKTQWNMSEFRILSKNISKDPTLQAFGIISKGIGARCDLIVFDDICDMSDVFEPKTRVKKIEWFQTQWMSRLVPGGRAVYIATAYHEEDLTHKLLSNRRWSFLWMGVSEDFKKIDCKLYNAGEGHPLLLRK